MNWKYLKRRFPDLFFETLIIIIGITISFYINSWQISNKDREIEKDFLIGLKNDLRNEIINFNDDIKHLVLIQNAYKYFTKDTSILTKDSCDFYFFKLYNFINIESKSNGRFESLKFSGNIDVIKNVELRVKIYRYFEELIPRIDNSNKMFNSESVVKLDDFIDKHLSYASNTAQRPTLNEIKQVIVQILPQNIFKIRHGGIKQTIARYETAISECDSIIKLINVELNK